MFDDSSIGIKTFNNVIACGLWIIGFLMLGVRSTPFIGALLFVPFALGPHAVTHAGILLAKKDGTQAVLLVTMLLYFAWFIFIYVNAFYAHPDPQSGIVMVFVAVYSLPVMLVAWITAILVESKKKNTRNRNATSLQE